MSLTSGQADVKAALDTLISKVQDAVAYASSIQPALQAHNAALILDHVVAAKAALQAVLPQLQDDSAMVPEIANIVD